MCYVQLFLALPAGQESFSRWDNWWNCYSGIKDGCTRKEVLVDKSVYLLEPGSWLCNRFSVSSSLNSTRFKVPYPLCPSRHFLTLVKRFVILQIYFKNPSVIDIYVSLVFEKCPATVGWCPVFSYGKVVSWICKRNRSKIAALSLLEAHVRKQKLIEISWTAF